MVFDKSKLIKYYFSSINFSVAHCLSANNIIENAIQDTSTYIFRISEYLDVILSHFSVTSELKATDYRIMSAEGSQRNPLRQSKLRLGRFFLFKVKSHECNYFLSPDCHRQTSTIYAYGMNMHSSSQPEFKLSFASAEY